MRLPGPARHTLTANAGFVSRSESDGGDQLPLAVSLRSRRLAEAGDEGEAGRFI